MQRSILALLPLVITPLSAQWIPANPVTAFEKQPDGVLFTMQTGAQRDPVADLVRTHHIAVYTAGKK